MQQYDEDIDADAQTVEEMSAGLIKHIFGKGEQGIREKLRTAQDIPREVGALAFTLVDAGADQAEKAGREFDIDMLMGVATEVIDSLLQMVEAMGLIESADDDDLREESLMYAIEAYIATGQPSPEDIEAAKMMLSQMADSGDVDEAERQISAMGQKRGMDPFADEEVDAGAGAGQPPTAGRPPVPMMQE